MQEFGIIILAALTLTALVIIGCWICFDLNACGIK